MRATLVRNAVVASAAAVVAAACSDRAPTQPEVPRGPDATTTEALAARGLQWPFVQRAPKGPPVLVGAGDIAACDPRYQDEATAALLDGIDGTVMAVGDDAYPAGSPADFRCYDASWGRHKKRTRPAAGNHEYLTPGALGYFAYFKKSSNPPFGYYSYDLGSWHVVVLNSTPQVYLCWAPEVNEVGADPAELPAQFPVIPPPDDVGPAAGRLCAGDLAQQGWLIADLSAHQDALCTVAYFHHPRFSSGQHGNHYQMQKIWDILYAFGADVVVSGHDHLYERFAPQNSEAGADPNHGIRQFTVGTGGAPLYGFADIQPNSERRDNTTHGVLKLGLNAGSYTWEFVPVAGGAFSDAGSGTCHGAPGPLPPTLPF
jgi:acid phosphatase type 7